MMTNSQAEAIMEAFKELIIQSNKFTNKRGTPEEKAFWCDVENAKEIITNIEKAQEYEG